MNERILDTAYVVMDKFHNYFTARIGLFRTEKGAKKECERMSRVFPSREYRVVKVNLVIVEESDDNRS